VVTIAAMVVALTGVEEMEEGGIPGAGWGIECGMERRHFLAVLGAAVGSVIPYSLYRYLEGGFDSQVAGVRDYLDAGPDAALKLITPNSDFYVTTSRDTPEVDPRKWSFAIDGLVERPLRFTYGEMLAQPKYETVMTLECISNPVGGKYLGNARWRGTLLKPLLERAGLRPKAKFAISHGAEGYTTAIPVERILSPLNFLAWDMNGVRLPRQHGFPLRVFFPGKYGMKQPKWLTRIEFVDHDYTGYWESQGWSQDCQRQIQSKIDWPRDGGRVSGSKVVVCGYALASEAGISKVEISTDDGRSWQAADVFSNPSPIVWALWKYEWKNPVRGTHRLKVRAIDGRGVLQTAGTSGQFPNGATGYHSVKVSVA
jgi:DMSO/TMAO reductase YedYZ molybdopterin-dependent catalytic subunit